jgi:hypothetical protein
MLLCVLAGGCAAWTNPVANGIPVRRLPQELVAGRARDQMQTIPLTLLRQAPSKEYRLAPQDVLGIFIDGVLPLTSPEQALPQPPVYFPSQFEPLRAGLSPALGFPIPVRDDGTISLPLAKPLPVAGLTVEQATEAIRRVYLDAGILQEGRERIIVNLMQTRLVRVTVFRQEVGGFTGGVRGFISSSSEKQGTGHIVDLRAYENDVLNALASTGGLPGLDAYDSIYIFRGGQTDSALTNRLQTLPPGENPLTLADLHVPTVRIPTRWPRYQPLPFDPRDVILESGDVVFLEARVHDLFYTGGLLPAGEHELPRDYDLDVLEAVAQVRGTLLNGAFGGSNLSGELLNPGIGNPSPSLLTVIRRTPGGGQVPIKVDLNRALRDPRERILVQPGDVLVLQETPGEALSRYLSDVFNFTIIARVIERGSTDGVATLSVFDSFRDNGDF